MNNPNSSSCWIEVFELSRYRGRRRRLYGPADFVSLRLRSDIWGISLDSLIVGPEAYVRFYTSSDPATTALWLTPAQSVPDVIEFKIDDSVDSIQIRDRAPIKGEPGYEALVQLLEKRKAHD